MKLNEHGVDLSYAEVIGMYIADIEATVSRFDLDFEKFLADIDARNSIAMSIQQIGEASSKLSEAFKTKHSNMPWAEIKAFRNRIAHAYDGLDMEVMWDIVEHDIPKLKTFVEERLGDV